MSHATKNEHKKDEGFNWEKLSKKGKQDADIKDELNKHMEKYRTLLLEADETPSQSEFQTELLPQIRTSLYNVFNSYDLPEKEQERRLESFLDEIQTFFNEYIDTHALAELTLEASQIYNIIKAINALNEEVQIHIDKEQVRFRFMDPSRVTLVQVFITAKTYKFFREGRIAVHLGDFANLLSATTSEKSSTTIRFTPKNIIIIKESEKLRAPVRSTLSLLDLDIEEIPMDMLFQTTYPFTFELSQDQYKFLLKELDTLSEIVNLKAEPQQITFYNSGQVGTRNIVFQKKYLKSLEFVGTDVIQTQIEREQEKPLPKEHYEKMLRLRIRNLKKQKNRLHYKKYRDERRIRELNVKIAQQKRLPSIEDEDYKELHDRCNTLMKEQSKINSEIRELTKKIEITTTYDFQSFTDSQTYSFFNAFLHYFEKELGSSQRKNTQLRKFIGIFREFIEIEQNKLTEEELENAQATIEQLEIELTEIEAEIEDLQEQLPDRFRNDEYIRTLEKNREEELSLPKFDQIRQSRIKTLESEIKRLEEKEKSVWEEYQNPTLIEKLQEQLREPHATGGYSLLLLKTFSHLTNLLDARDSVHFSLKTDHPLKLYMELPLLNTRKATVGSLQGWLFLAPRVEEAEFDGEDELDEF